MSFLEDFEKSSLFFSSDFKTKLLVASANDGRPRLENSFWPITSKSPDLSRPKIARNIMPWPEERTEFVQSRTLRKKIKKIQKNTKKRRRP